MRPPTVTYSLTPYIAGSLVPGKLTTWEIDAKGVKSDGIGFVVVECRRYTNSRLNKTNMGALVFTIQDTGAQGGIVVSPLDLQSGAKKIAASANVQHVTLNPDSTTSDYVMRFLDRVSLGVTLQAPAGLYAKVIRVGKVIDERQS
jgi:Restriction endonuclease